MEQYLVENYRDKIILILNNPNDKTYGSLEVDLLQMQQKEIDWFQAIMYDVHSELPKWNAALFNTQRLMVELQDEILDVGYQIKANCYVHFINMPQDPECKLPFPNHAQIGLFRQVKGTVVRMSQTKLLEIKRDFICLNCQIQLH